MAVHEQVHSLSPDQLESVSGGTGALGVYRPGFQYKQESLDFFRHCVGEETYQLAMNSDAGREHHYAVARAFLNQVFEPERVGKVRVDRGIRIS